MKQLLADLDVLKSKGKMKVKYKNRTILLLYVEDQIYAIDDKCPHMGVSLYPGKVEDGILYCKDHHLGIDIETGVVANEKQADFLRLESFNRYVKMYPIDIVEGKIYLK